MPTRMVDGLAIEVEGEGPPVVCIHGLGGTSNSWTPIMRALRGFRVVRVDLPGSGRSAGAVGEISISRMVSGVADACQALDIAGAHFLGHSMGTIVSQHLAHRHPSLVRSLALFAPFAFPADAARTAFRTRALKVRDGGVVAMQEVADAVVQATTSASTREGLPLVAAFVRESVMRQEPFAYSRCCEAMAEAPPTVLEEIRVPVLLVTGDEDAAATPGTVRAMAERLVDARVTVLNRCGHWPTLERPIECTQVLEQFLHKP